MQQFTPEHITYTAVHKSATNGGNLAKMYVSLLAQTTNSTKSNVVIIRTLLLINKSMLNDIMNLSEKYIVLKKYKDVVLVAKSSIFKEDTVHLIANSVTNLQNMHKRKTVS
jgi:hypothetical protein